MVHENVIGYISYPKVLISWILAFLPYHAKLGQVFSNSQ